MKKQPEKREPMEHEMTEDPCPRCLPLAGFGQIRLETVQRMPKGAAAPVAKEKGGGPCCLDCAAADLLLSVSGAPGFLAARIAVGNDRQEQYRLPGVPMGLVMAGYVRPSKKGDFEKQLAWLEKNDYFGMREVGSE
jgi:hypothetical protein